MSFTIPTGEARFAFHKQHGWRVRVSQADPDVDLSGTVVEVVTKGGTRRVRLTKRLAAATEDRPGLYKFGSQQDA